jgi:hypothetical protein
LAVKRAIVLFAFAWSVDSYGVDWTILQVLPLVVALFVYAPFFTSERLVASRSVRALSSPGATSTHLAAFPHNDIRP